jgi:glutathione S-transferase
MKRFPILVDRDRTILEATTVIEYLEVHYPGPVRFIPASDTAVEVRMLDRVFDNYVMMPMQKIVLDRLRPEPYRAAARSLFYADWAHEIPACHANLRGYRYRLLARPCIARAVDEARAYRRNFPLGAPDRD